MYGRPPGLPPSQDPELNARYAGHSPDDRFHGTLYALGAVILLLVVAAVAGRLL